MQKSRKESPGKHQQKRENIPGKATNGAGNDSGSARGIVDAAPLSPETEENGGRPEDVGPHKGASSTTPLK